MRVVDRPLDVHSPRLLVVEVHSGAVADRASKGYQFKKPTCPGTSEKTIATTTNLKMRQHDGQKKGFKISGWRTDCTQIRKNEAVRSRTCIARSELGELADNLMQEFSAARTPSGPPSSAQSEVDLTVKVEEVSWSDDQGIFNVCISFALYVYESAKTWIANIHPSR